MINYIIEGYRDNGVFVELVFLNHKPEAGGYRIKGILYADYYAYGSTYSDLYKNDDFVLTINVRACDWVQLTDVADLCAIVDDIRKIPDIPKIILHRQNPDIGHLNSGGNDEHPHNLIIRNFIVWLQDIFLEKIESLPLSTFTFALFSGNKQCSWNFVAIFDEPCSESLISHIKTEYDDKLDMIYTLGDNGEINIRYLDEKEGACFNNYWFEGKHVPASLVLYNQNLITGGRWR